MATIAQHSPRVAARHLRFALLIESASLPTATARNCAGVRFQSSIATAACDAVLLSRPPTETIMSTIPDVEDIHAEAVARGASSYIDPTTGFTCFTELLHLKRGTCCGNMCRHCPYGWDAVKGVSKPAVVESGDFDAVDKRLQMLLGDKYKPIKPRVMRKRLKPPSTSSPTPSTLEARRHISADIASITSSDSSGSNTGVTLKQTPKAAPGKGGQSRTITSAQPTSKNTEKNVPYTRTGDKGTSQLGNGERRSKCDCNFEALGTVDELCSNVGSVHANLVNDGFDYGPLPEWLLDVMSRLFDIGTHVAKPHAPDKPFVPDGVGGGLDPAHIDELEAWIDQMTKELPELLSFILPTGAPAAASLHIARTVCRRCERHLVPLGDTCDPNVLRYTNRLSDFLFTAARYVNLCQGQEEIQYRRPLDQATQRQRMTRQEEGSDESK